MLLAFDIGNTSIVLGVFQGDRLIQNWRLKTDKNKSADEYGMIINQLFHYEGLDLKDINDVIISTVVQPILFPIQHFTMKYLHKKAIVIGPDINTGLVIKYENPNQLGADRIINAVAGYANYGGPLIIVDFGTATTFCAINEKAKYLGGTISPGIKISSEALFEKTAALSKVELKAPGNTICCNTKASIQSGLVYGHMGLTDYIIRNMKQEMISMHDIKNKVTVVATGGFSSLVGKGLECIDYIDKYLALEGLQIIYEKNKTLHSNSIDYAIDLNGDVYEKKLKCFGIET